MNTVIKSARIDHADLELAQKRLEHISVLTRIERSRHFNEQSGCEVFFKTENRQRSGSIHFRSAFNKIKAETERAPVALIVTTAAGNFAVGMALAANLLALPIRVVIPNGRTDCKLSAMKGYGAEVFTFDPSKQRHQEAARNSCSEAGSLLISDHPDSLTMSGEGTAVIEFLKDCPQLDCLVLPQNDEFENRGCMEAAWLLDPHLKIFAAKIQSRSRSAGSEFPDLAEEIYVSESEAIDSQIFILERMKMILEPSAAIAAAAVRFNKDIFKGKNVGVVLTSGNVDFNQLSQALSKGLPDLLTKANATSAQYCVECYTCRSKFDALDTIFCDCLTTERTPVCPKCLNCFCKATQEYKDRFWSTAPQQLWDVNRLERSGPEPDINPPLNCVTRPLVLVVDPDKQIEAQALRMIEGLGYGAIVARDGQEGLEVAQKYLPELILTDALMPKLDGREMCRILKQNAATSKIKMVVMTALYTQEKYRSEAFKRFHVDEYLSKPLNFIDLARLLQKFVG